MGPRKKRDVNPTTSSSSKRTTEACAKIPLSIQCLLPRETTRINSSLRGHPTKEEEEHVKNNIVVEEEHSLPGPKMLSLMLHALYLVCTIHQVQMKPQRVSEVRSDNDSLRTPRKILGEAPPLLFSPQPSTLRLSSPSTTPPSARIIQMCDRVIAGVSLVCSYASFSINSVELLALAFPEFVELRRNDHDAAIFNIVLTREGVPTTLELEGLLRERFDSEHKLQLRLATVHATSQGNTTERSLNHNNSGGMNQTKLVDPSQLEEEDVSHGPNTNHQWNGLEKFLSATKVQQVSQTVHDEGNAPVTTEFNQIQLDVERSVALFDLIRTIFGVNRSEMGGAKLLCLLHSQNRHGDTREAIVRQLRHLSSVEASGVRFLSPQRRTVRNDFMEDCVVQLDRLKCCRSLMIQSLK